MDKPPRPAGRLEGILKETLFEISQGKNDPFHAVLADVLDDITAHEGRADDKTEITKKDSG
jgi:hypothetical protein